MSAPYNAIQDGWHLTVSFGGRRPPIVCLCGSTRFVDAFTACTKRLTEKGEIVLAPGVWDRDLTTEAKDRLDTLHLRKVDLADYVLVLNVDGYVGEHTQAKIDYATKLRKPVVYLEPQPGVLLYQNAPPLGSPVVGHPVVNGAIEVDGETIAVERIRVTEHDVTTTFVEIVDEPPPRFEFDADEHLNVWLDRPEESEPT